jgi:hypothetical protein
MDCLFLFLVHTLQYLVLSVIIHCCVHVIITLGFQMLLQCWKLVKENLEDKIKNNLETPMKLSIIDLNVRRKR